MPHLKGKLYITASVMNNAFLTGTLSSSRFYLGVIYCSQSYGFGIVNDY